MVRSTWMGAVFGVALAAVAAASCAAGDGECRYNSDCTDAYCHEGKCKKDCVDSTLDCPPGYTCGLTAQCVPADGAGGGGGGDDDGGGAPAADAGPEAPDGGAPGEGPDGGPGPGPDGGTDGGATTPTKALLDGCASDAQCATGLCRPYYVGGPSRCTKACGSNADCMQNTRCAEVGGSKICMASDVGRDCAGAADCSFGCLTNQGYCTAACANASDCPNGYGCMPVGGQRVCVKAAAACGPGDTAACIAEAACDESGLVSSCTLACNTAADCPQRAMGFAPWTCDGGGVCRRPPDVYGPLGNGEPAEYACNAQRVVVSICNDAQHINFAAFTFPPIPAVSCAATMTTPGVPGDVCLDSCRYKGGCTFGYACTALGSVGSQRVGLCLPTHGNGEVGTPCAADEDCFFGHCNRNTNLCSRDCTVDGLCPTGSTCNTESGPLVEGRSFRRCAPTAP